MKFQVECPWVRCGTLAIHASRSDQPVEPSPPDVRGLYKERSANATSPIPYTASELSRTVVETVGLLVSARAECPRAPLDHSSFAVRAPVAATGSRNGCRLELRVAWWHHRAYARHRWDGKKQMRWGRWWEVLAVGSVGSDAARTSAKSDRGRTLIMSKPAQPSPIQPSQPSPAHINPYQPHPIQSIVQPSQGRTRCRRTTSPSSNCK